MKKLLTILGALGIVSTGATSAVVSCSKNVGNRNISTWNGQIMAEKPESGEASHFSDLYRTVGDLQKQILFILQISMKDLESFQLYKSIDKNPDNTVAIHSGSLSNSSYYFVSMKARAGNPNGINGELDKRLITSGVAGMFDLSRVRGFEFIANLNQDAAGTSVDANVTMLHYFLKETGMTVSDTVFAANFVNILDHPIFHFTSQPKIGNLLYSGSQNDLQAGEVSWFKNKLKAQYIWAKIGYDIANLDDLKTITLPQSDFTAKDATYVVNKAGKQELDSEIKQQIQAQIDAISASPGFVQEGTDYIVDTGVVEGTTAATGDNEGTAANSVGNVSVVHTKNTLTGEDRTLGNEPIRYYLKRASS